jgi:hypothetical protein
VRLSWNKFFALGDHSRHYGLEEQNRPCPSQIARLVLALPVVNTAPMSQDPEFAQFLALQGIAYETVPPLQKVQLLAAFCEAEEGY